jgi:GTP 3',8-cyclase
VPLSFVATAATFFCQRQKFESVHSDPSSSHHIESCSLPNANRCLRYTMERPLLRSMIKARNSCPILQQLATRRHISSATSPAIGSVQVYPSPVYHDPLPAPLVEPAVHDGMAQSLKPFSSFLTDSYSRQHDYLRISITERCNLRCTYCMPEEGVPLSPPSHLLTTPEITYLSTLFVSEGVTKIRLTGGEPTIRRDILPLMHSIGHLRRQGLRELCITTNGIALHRKLDSMAEAGLTGVNLSLDTLDPFQFQIMTRRKGLDAVMRSMHRILEMNRLGAGIKLKINCVVMRGINDKEIIPFVELGREKDIDVRFIEYMPFDGNKWSRGKMFSYQEMLRIIRSEYSGLYKVQDHANDTSKTYQVPGFVGTIGFITSMTHNFCGSCNRLRITSDGKLKVCLFGQAEVNLRDLIRKGNGGQPIDEETMKARKAVKMDPRKCSTEETEGPPIGGNEHELLQVIGQAVQRKKEKHAGMGHLENMKNRPMILIGG